MQNLNFDVIVIGGGPAGSAAAIASVRNGAKTLLVERYGFLGGTATAAMMCIYAAGFHDGKRRIIKGLFSEIRDRLQATDSIVTSETLNSTDPFDPEMYKCVLDQMCMSSGVRLLFHSMVLGAEMEGSRIRSIQVATKQGIINLSANVFIDASGDGDLAVACGAPFEKGIGDQKAMPHTLTISIGNVDTVAFGKIYGGVNETGMLKADGFFEKEIAKARELGEWDILRKDTSMLWSSPYNNSEVFFNVTRVPEKDATDVWQLSEAELEGRRQAIQVLKFLKKYITGFENAYLGRLAPQIGIRQSRQIVGDYYITEQDINEYRQFEDVIAQGNYGIDIHHPVGMGSEQQKIPEGYHYDIPYRALLPKGVDNLLTAGRCISGSPRAMAAYRVMSIVTAIGEGAGTAAALCIAKKVDPREMDVKLLQDRLVTQGACLE